jgi:hypothetical protein
LASILSKARLFGAPVSSAQLSRTLGSAAPEPWFDFDAIILAIDHRYARLVLEPRRPLSPANGAPSPGVDAVQTKAGGNLLSPVGARLQVAKTVFRTQCSLFFMVPPRAVHA